VNIVGGVVILLGIGFVLTRTVSLLVRRSGLPLIDDTIVRWMAASRTPATLDAAGDVLGLDRGIYLMIAVTVLAVVLHGRSRVWRTDIVGVLGSIGAFVPLVLISLATSWAAPPARHGAASLLPNQAVVVTVGLCTIAWLLSRRFGWAVAATAWTAATIGLVVVSAARVYVGLSLPSQTIGAVILGGLWVLVFAAAWRSRDRVLSTAEASPAADPDDRGADPSVFAETLAADTA
jgi:undecaprenyl-diphosphatase